MSSPQPFGRYVLHRLLAKGGMAEIFDAEMVGAEGFSKRVAVKRTLPHLSEDAAFTAMFLDEARLASKLSHPNVVQVFDFGEVEGRYYLAMEFLDGASLSTLVRAAKLSGQPLPQRVVLQLMAAAADGLYHAHSYVDDGQPLHIVHRDISPSNIMITMQGGVKVLDFGIARAANRQQDATETGIVKGKVPYCSPEQLRADSLDARSDLFSLGIVLWELLCGQWLFRREKQLDTVMAVLEGPIPAPSTVRPDIDARLDAVVAKALERDVTRRYQTALELRRDLEALMSGPPVRLDEFVTGLLGPQSPPPPRASQSVLPSVDVQLDSAPVRPPQLATPPPAPLDATGAIAKPPTDRRLVRSVAVMGAIAAAIILGAGLKIAVTPEGKASGATAADQQAGNAQVGNAQVGNAQTGNAQVGNAQVGTAQVGTAQVGTAQVGTAQVGAAQVGNAQVGNAQVGNAQVGNTQVGNTQVGNAQVGTAQTGADQTGTTQTGTAQTGAAQTGAAQTGSTAVGNAQVGNTQTGTAQTGTTQTGTAQTGTTQTGTTQTGTVQTGTTQTGTAQTGTAQTGTTQTGTTQTGTTQTGTTKTGTAKSPTTKPRPVTAKTPAAPVEPARLDVSCAPWCRIFVDERDVGQVSPLVGFELKPGNHTLRVEHPPSGHSSQKSFAATAGQHLKEQFNLR